MKGEKGHISRRQYQCSKGKERLVLLPGGSLQQQTTQTLPWEAGARPAALRGVAGAGAMRGQCCPPGPQAGGSRHKEGENNLGAIPGCRQLPAQCSKQLTGSEPALVLPPA